MLKRILIGSIYYGYNFLLSELFRKIFFLSVIIFFLTIQNFWLYFLIGIIASFGMALIDFENYEEKLLKENIKAKWFHYLPVFILDIIIWPYPLSGFTVNALTGRAK